MSATTSHTVIGAGPVGTLMALMLANRGHSVRLIERRADPRTTPPERGRSINLAMAARGLLALEHAGLLARIAPAMMPMPGRMLHDEHGALRFLRYGQNEREIIYAVSRERLNRILVEAAAESPGIELRFDTRCVELDAAGASVTLRDERDGRPYQEPFEVLLAADGAGSAVRAALSARGMVQAHEQPLDHDYKELTIPAHTARSEHYAFEPQALHIWPRGGYMLIALPNTDGSFTATLFLPRHGVPGFDHLHNARSVQSLFKTEFADAERAIPNLTQQFAAHPQGQLGTLYCQGWQFQGRVLLLGDAAHAIVPFHGQGLNCGFEDCRLLDQLLSGGAARTSQQRTALFERFEHERRPDTDAIAAMALENYQEMRDAVRSPHFRNRQALAAALEREFPGRFIPRYSMVMFHPEIPYSQARRRGSAQERVLDTLLAENTSVAIGPAARVHIEALLDQSGL